MILGLLINLMGRADCERFLDRHVIADSPYTEEQEEEYFSRLKAVESLYRQHEREVNLTMEER